MRYGLIAPGEYIENISISNLDITLASEYILNQDTSVVSSTIINGNNITQVYGLMTHSLHLDYCTNQKSI